MVLTMLHILSPFIAINFFYDNFRDYLLAQNILEYLWCNAPLNDYYRGERSMMLR